MSYSPWLAHRRQMSPEFLGFYLCFWTFGGSMDTAWTWEIDSLHGPYADRRACDEQVNTGSSECFVKVLRNLDTSMSKHASFGEFE